VNRPLSLVEHQLLSVLIDRYEADDRVSLRAQIASLRVVGGVSTLFELAPVGDVPLADLPDGPLPIQAYVCDKNGSEAGEMIVWISSGILSGLEYAWFTETPPEGMPRADQLVSNDN
jgi:hypothetical protein